MPLTLSIRNATQLENGSPISLILDKRGAVIGRAPTTDWCLPDAQLHISSRHAEIRFQEGRYELIDLSTNGTFLHGEAARLPGVHTISQGDVIVVGRFEIVASLDEAAAAIAAERNAAPQVAQWQGWAAAAGIDPAAPPPESAADGWGSSPSAVPEPATGGWGAPASAAPPSAWGVDPVPPPPAAAGWGAQPAQALDGSSSGWGAPSAAPASPAAAAPSPSAASSWPPPPSAPAPANPSTWASAQAPAAAASDWSSPVGASSPQGAGDVWGKFAASNVVDWARGGFGQAAPQPAPAPAPPRAELAAHAMPTPTLSAPQAPGTVPPPAGAPAAQAYAASQPATFDALAALAAGGGFDRAMLTQEQAAAITAAGDLLRRLVAGMVVMLEARARAKSQMGAQGTSLEFDGNNPLKFARSPELALVQLLNPPERGFMPGERAIEDAFKDLQAHQMATLMAMQGALRSTLERFSPDSIRKRAETGGLMSKIMPGARDAALWAAYEKEFSGVAKGSDEAFMDVFAKEFRTAYEQVSHQR